MPDAPEQETPPLSPEEAAQKEAESKLETAELNNRAGEELNSGVADTLAKCLLVPELKSKLDALANDNPQARIGLDEFKAFDDSFGNQEFISGLPTREATEPVPEKEKIMASIMELMIRGHVSGQVLGKILDGGIKLTDQFPGTPSSGAQGGEKKFENIAFFQPKTGKAGLENNCVLLSPKLFAKPAAETAGQPSAEVLDARYAIWHEIAHAYLANLNFYPSRKLPDQTDEPNAILKFIFDPISQPGLANNKECAVFEIAATRPQLAKPFETPYVADLLDQYDKNRDPKFWRHVAGEMMAERLTQFFASDGSLGNFLKKRLEGMSAMARAASSGPGTAEQFKPIAQELATIITPDQPDNNPKLSELVPKLQALALKLPAELQESFANFLKETIVLHKRFGSILHGESGLAIGHESNKDTLARQLAQLQNKSQYGYNDLMLEGFDDYMPGALPLLSDTSLMSSKPRAPKKSFFQALGGALKELWDISKSAIG